MDSPFTGIQPETSGIQAGFLFTVVHNGSGYYNGYVHIPKGHPWHGQGYDEIDCDCHGGLTYSRMNDADDWWIGFDTAHLGDRPNPDLYPRLDSRLVAIYERFERSDDHAWEIDEVADECRRICNQARQAQPAPVEGYSLPLAICHGGMIGRFGHFVWINGSDQCADDYRNALETGGFTRFGAVFFISPDNDRLRRMYGV